MKITFPYKVLNYMEIITSTWRSLVPVVALSVFRYDLRKEKSHQFLRNW